VGFLTESAEVTETASIRPLPPESTLTSNLPVCGRETRPPGSTFWRQDAGRASLAEFMLARSAP
jgi:hypothetical protein